MDIAPLIQSLAAEVGIPVPRADAWGAYRFLVDDMALVVFPVPESQSLALLGHVGTVAAGDFDALGGLLAANESLPRGAHLAVDEAMNVMLVQWLGFASIDAVSFVRELDAFLDTQAACCSLPGVCQLPAPQSHEAEPA